MKKTILYSIVGVTLLLVILLKSGLMYVSISPYYHYKLNETETKIFNDELFKVREMLENSDFEELKNEFVDDGQDGRSRIYSGLKHSREKFGKSLSSEFFRSSPPYPASKIYKNLDGTFYSVFYFTKTERDEFFEVIDWIVSGNNEARIVNYSNGKIVEWQSKSRDRESYLDLNFPNEFRIPFGERFIEIRY